MKRQPELKVTEVPVDGLLPYANNAKVHTNEQIDQLVNSIGEFGFDDPVGIWHNADGEPEIVEGHGRILAAKRLGLKTVPAIILDHLSDEQRRAYALVCNQLTMSTGWDFDRLDADMQELEFDWEDFGFKQYDYDPDSLYQAEQKDAKDDQGQGTVDGERTVVCPNCGNEFQL